MPPTTSEVLALLIPMFALVFAFGAFFRYVVARMVLGKDLYDRLTTDPQGRKHGKSRFSTMQSAFSSWRKPALTDIMPKIASTTVEGRRGRPYGTIIGAMQLNVSHSEIHAFDWKLMQRGACASIQTVIVVEPPVAEDLVPDFYLHPIIRRYKTPMAFPRYDPVEGMEFPDYWLASQDPTPKARELFETDRENGGQLFEYVRSRNWTVEWSGKRLLVYQFDKCVPPNELTRVTSEVLTFSDLILKTAALLREHVAS